MIFKILKITQILFSLTLAVLYPIWLSNGVFEGYWYGIIGSAVAIYGSLIAGTYHYYKTEIEGK